MPERRFVITPQDILNIPPVLSRDYSMLYLTVGSGLMAALDRGIDVTRTYDPLTGDIIFTWNE